MAIYKGKEVSIIRDADRNDPRWGSYDDMLVVATDAGRETLTIGELELSPDEAKAIYDRKLKALKEKLDASVGKTAKLEQAITDQQKAIEERDANKQKAMDAKYRPQMTEKQKADEKAYQDKKAAGKLTPKEIEDHDNAVRLAKLNYTVEHDRAAMDKQTNVDKLNQIQNQSIQPAKRI